MRVCVCVCVFVCVCVQVLFEIMTATGLATLCWALASLQHRPPGFWAEGAMATLVHKMSTIPTVS